ncbi:hypothetical protein BCO26_2144 [Heyndrickxia coagulans 2-6]|nr:hypothetical protein BCO26_2144 [Heyndrickxia coagulans 2-6]
MKDKHQAMNGELSFIGLMKDKTRVHERQIVLHKADERQNPGRGTANCPS